MLVLAHRGASAYAPENTASAFYRAVELGADGVELDVHWTADKKAVVLHDYFVDSTSDGQGRVSELTWEQLRSLDFGCRFEGSFGPERLLLLEEALEICRRLPVINIEIKAPRRTYVGLPEYVGALVRKMGMDGQAVVSSFCHGAALEAKRENPNLHAAFLFGRVWLRPAAAEYAAKRGADAIHPAERLVTTGLVRRCEKHGLAVVPWTVDDPEHAAHFAAMGCAAVISNRPDEIKRRLQKK